MFPPEASPPFRLQTVLNGGLSSRCRFVGLNLSRYIFSAVSRCFFVPPLLRACAPSGWPDPQNAVLFLAPLCSALLYYTVLYFAFLCYTLLYYTILYFALLSFIANPFDFSSYPVDLPPNPAGQPVSFSREYGKQAFSPLRKSLFKRRASLFFGPRPHCKTAARPFGNKIFLKPGRSPPKWFSRPRILNSPRSGFRRRAGMLVKNLTPPRMPLF